MSALLREVLRQSLKPLLCFINQSRAGFHAPLPSADVDAQHYRTMLAEMQRVQQQVETLMTAHAARQQQHNAPRPPSPPRPPHPAQQTAQHAALANAAQRTWARRGGYARKPDALAVARQRLQAPRIGPPPEASDRLAWVKHMITFTQDAPAYLPSTAAQASGTSEVAVNADGYACLTARITTAYAE